MWHTGSKRSTDKEFSGNTHPTSAKQDMPQLQIISGLRYPFKAYLASEKAIKLKTTQNFFQVYH